jgi:hypothetical protein
LERSCGERSITCSQGGERNILCTREKMKANWISCILRRNCLLKQVVKGNIEEIIEVTGRRRRRKQLAADHKQTRRCCELKQEALDRTVGRSRFG